MGKVGCPLYRVRNTWGTYAMEPSREYKFQSLCTSSSGPVPRVQQRQPQDGHSQENISSLYVSARSSSLAASIGEESPSGTGRARRGLAMCGRQKTSKHERPSRTPVTKHARTVWQKPWLDLLT